MPRDRALYVGRHKGYQPPRAVLIEIQQVTTHSLLPSCSWREANYSIPEKGTAHFFRLPKFGAYLPPECFLLILPLRSLIRMGEGRANPGSSLWAPRSPARRQAALGRQRHLPDPARLRGKQVQTRTGSWDRTTEQSHCVFLIFTQTPPF